MTSKLYYSTVSPTLRAVLEQLMNADLLSSFRLVGGTALSLHIGHRISVDIDLFTERPYGSIDFDAIDRFFRSTYNYVDVSGGDMIGFGRMYIVGNDERSSVKVDLMYTDEFIRDPIIADDIRMASVEDIIAMKLDILSRRGRKKDFWDLHALVEKFTLKEMIAFHKERYPYTHDAGEIQKGFSRFSKADDEFDPQCLHGKHWELIKLDMIEFAQKG